MKSVNQVALLGHLAADPELRETESGRKVASFSLATDFRWKTQDGVQRKNTNFHRISAWSGLAEICKQHLKKGSAVFVSGRLSNRDYKGKDGKTNYITEVVAEDVSILSWKKSEGVNAMDIEKIAPEEE